MAVNNCIGRYSVVQG